MRKLPRLPVALLALIVCLPAAAEQVSIEADLTPLARRMTGKLGAAAYEDRVAATRLLRGLGEHAVPALEGAAESEDPEIRYRATRLLLAIRSGVTEAWPDEFRRKARNYSDLPKYERETFLVELAAHFTESARAVPFIVPRILQGDEEEAEAGFEALRYIRNPKAGRAALDIVGTARAPRAVRVRAWGLDRAGRPLQAYLALADLKIPDTENVKLEAAVGEVIDRMREQEDAGALVTVRRLREKHAGALRLVYLEALLARRLGNPERSGELLARARRMHPATKRPHYRAGRMLSEMGRRRMAEPEWRAVLELQPVEGPYTIYAMLGLAADSANGGRYRRAAELLTDCLETLIEMRDSNHPMGILGVEVARVHQVVNELRAQAVRYGDEDQAPVVDELPETELRATVELRAEEPGTPTHLTEAVTRADVHLRLEAVPAEFDLTAMPPALRVDAGDKTVELLFAGVPAAPTLEWAGRPPSALVALHVRDYTCLFRLDVRTARARKLGTLRWDARVQLQAGPMLQIYEDITVKFRGKSFTWEEAAAGIPVAWPVETLRFTVVGTAPSGRRNRSDFTIDLQAHDVLRRQL